MEPSALKALVLSARWVVIDSERVVENGGLLVQDGRVQRVLASPAALRRAVGSARRIDCPGGVLAPGWVNAHAHLELGALHGRLPAGVELANWIEALLPLRARLTAAQLQAGVERGVRELLAGGCTAIGDIDSSGAAPRALAALGRAAPRARVYREVLDVGDAERAPQAFEQARAALAGRARRARLLPGLSPHAPYTVSDALLQSIAEVRRWRQLPLSMHWAETRAEHQWALHSSGPLSRVLRYAPGRAGLTRLAAAGLLGPRMALIHGNHPRAGEPERIAQAGASLVHCPGSHLFFARERFALQRYRKAGVRLALGTDSAASNAALDMRRELALLSTAHPGLAPAEAFAMATSGGARALGLAGEIGELRPGCFADCVWHELSARGPRALFEALVQARAAVRAVWIGGGLVFDSSQEPWSTS